METEKMIYLVTEYAAGGEIFGNCVYILFYFLVNKALSRWCHTNDAQCSLPIPESLQKYQT